MNRTIDLERYQLSEVAAREIFLTEIVPQHLTAAQPVPHPVLTLIAGQPGAGKTSLATRAEQSFAEAGGVVVINSDTYKPFHPEWKRLLREDDTTAVTFTRFDGRRWMAMAGQWCQQHRLNVIMETTMQDPSLFEHPLQQFATAGYSTGTAVLAVSESLSRLGILERYVDQRRDSGKGRLTETSAHDAAYHGVERGLRQAEQLKLSEEISIWRRGDELVYSNRLTPEGQWALPATGVQELQRVRTETLRYAEALQALASLDKVAQALPGAEWEAPLAQVKQLVEAQVPPAAKAAHLVNPSFARPLTTPFQRQPLTAATKVIDLSRPSVLQPSPAERSYSAGE